MAEKRRQGKRQKPKPKTTELMLRNQLDKLLPLWDALSTDPVLPLVRKSYVLSRLWAWACRIQTEPKLRIPVPRHFTRRDP